MVHMVFGPVSKVTSGLRSIDFQCVAITVADSQPIFEVRGLRQVQSKLELHQPLRV